MQERHRNRTQYFNEQVYTTQKYVIPFVSEQMPIHRGMRILEVGCGEGGNLKPFLDAGCHCLGVDLAEGKIEKGKKVFDEDPNSSRIDLMVQDIYEAEDIGLFDLIMLRDVIEHIHDQNRFMGFISKFLKPQGKIFFGFPPWQNPFGGHQQVCENRILSTLPWYHLLPEVAYEGMLKLGGESPERIEGLKEIKTTGISIERFESILKRNGYSTDCKHHFLFNPNYEIKFGIHPRRQFGIISAIPFIRNFATTAVYYLVSKNSKDSASRTE